MLICPKCSAIYCRSVDRCGIDAEPLEERRNDALVGRRIGQFLLGELLGIGGMGHVYRATDRSSGRGVAVKLLFGDLALQPSVVARFRREAEVMSRIAHPNVAAVLDFVTVNQQHILVMEVVAGRTLECILRIEGPFASGRAAGITRALASGLEAVHSLGIVHRDLKPANVMVTLNGSSETIKLIDFGVASVSEQELSGSRIPGPLTIEGQFVGTPVYAAPEQLSGSVVDFRADLYSLGLIVFEMLLGRSPFTDGGFAAIITQHLAGVLPPLPLRGGLGPLAHRLLEKRAIDRPTSATQVVLEIDHLFPHLVKTEVGSGGTRSPPIAEGDVAVDRDLEDSRDTLDIVESDGVRILLVDDDDDDHFITREFLLQTGSGYELEWINRYDLALVEITRNVHDLYLFDHGLGARTGTDLLRAMRERGNRKPVVFLTGRSEREIDREAMELGAFAYLVKGEFDSQTLDRTIRYALEIAKRSEVQRSAEERYELASRARGEGVWDWDLEKNTLVCSEYCWAILGLPNLQYEVRPEDWFGRVHPEDRLSLDGHLRSQPGGEIDSLEIEHRLRHADGSYRWVLGRARAVFENDGKARRIVGTVTEIEAKRMPRSSQRNRAL